MTETDFQVSLQERVWVMLSVESSCPEADLSGTPRKKIVLRNLNVEALGAPEVNCAKKFVSNPTTVRGGGAENSTLNACGGIQVIEANEMGDDSRVISGTCGSRN
jgi:hypothetical protein